MRRPEPAPPGPLRAWEASPVRGSNMDGGGTMTWSIDPDEEGQFMPTTSKLATPPKETTETAPIPVVERTELERSDEEAIRALREREFPRLDRLGHVYLDYTGGGLYAESQIALHAELLRSSVFGNPHSANPTSLASTRLLESARERFLNFFSADPDEYLAIFTFNASHALKLVGEAYPFTRGSQFLLTFDNHNSVNGIREFDRVRGAVTSYVPVLPPEMRVDDSALQEFLDRASPDRDNLFAYPAQSNFSGVQHPLRWIEMAQGRGWDVLLDAAAFVPTNRLDLAHWHPDFVTVSFYKMFGHPTGIGALVARRQALAKLHRPWFAGGTISVASVQADRFTPALGAAAFEDGTLPYTGIPALEFGFDLLESAGIDTIHRHVSTLTGLLIDELTALRHANGRPAIQLYGPLSTESRGGTIAFNVIDADGQVVDHNLIEERAGERKISLRTGCFCNPGAGEMALGLSRTEISSCFHRSGDRMTYDDFRRCIDAKSTGAVRVSLGIVSTRADVEAFVEFLKSELVQA